MVVSGHAGVASNGDHWIRIMCRFSSLITNGYAQVNLKPIDHSRTCVKSVDYLGMCTHQVQWPTDVPRVKSVGDQRTSAS